MTLQAGDYVHSKKDFTIYNKDGIPRLIKHPSRGIVKNVTKDFIFISDGSYFANDPSLYTPEFISERLTKNDGSKTSPLNTTNVILFSVLGISLFVIVMLISR